MELRPGYDTGNHIITYILFDLSLQGLLSDVLFRRQVRVVE